MKILLFGKNGQVGKALLNRLTNSDELIAVDRQQLDLANLVKLSRFIQQQQPHWIINAAAYTNVDEAESQIELVNLVNAEAVKVMAEEAKQCGAWLVHYSTDYVFDGSKKEAYSEDDERTALSCYAASKIKSEDYISNSGCRYLIFRSSWIYSLTGNSFIQKILNLAQQKESLSVVTDQVGAPNSADLVAKFSVHCINHIVNIEEELADHYSGIYHLTTQGQTNWYELAQLIVRHAVNNDHKLTLTESKLQPIKSSKYPAAATRPKNSLLNTTKLCQTFNLKMPDWQIDFMCTLNKLIPKHRESHE